MDAVTSSEVFLFDRFRLDRRGGGLFRRSDTGQHLPVTIGSRALEVLGVLIERRGDLVSKDEIMRAVWPGTVVEEANLTVQISALRRILDAERAGGSCIQTVPGRGYRLVLSVTQPGDAQTGPALAVPPAHPVARPEAAAPPRPRRQPWLWPAVGLSGLAVAMVLIVAAPQGGWLSRTPVPPRLSMVVLPFDNLGGDPGQDYLVEGITDDLTTDLSRLAGTFVIARESAYTYKGKVENVRTVGRDLGVRYVVEGSVRKLDDTLRVNVQLVSTETDVQLWADRFDEPVKDLSSGQEEIVRRIGETLDVALTDVESARSRRERPTNPDAFDLILRARSLGNHTMGPREHAERMILYEQALRLDPASILAMTGLVDELVRRTFVGYSTTGDDLGRAARLIVDAAAIDPNHSSVLGTTAFLLFAQDRYPEAISAYQRLLDEYPNSHFAYNQIGDCLIRIGKADEAVPMIETAIRRDPRSPYNWSRYDNLGFALLMLGRDEEAIVWTQRALAANPKNAAAIRAQYNLRLAAAHARLGHLDQAHRALAEANRIWPYYTVRSHFPDDPTSRVYAAQIERFQAALRFAGLRDHAEEDADFGVAFDDKLHQDLIGLTPPTVPGATTIRTTELERLLAERKPIVIDPLGYSWGRSIPGAVGLRNAFWGGGTSDAMQDRLGRKMRVLTKGDLSTPIVAVGWNSERFGGRNLALRLVALGYTQVYWYRGGREAWEVAGLPETEVDVQDW